MLKQESCIIGLDTVFLSNGVGGHDRPPFNNYNCLFYCFKLKQAFSSMISHNFMIIIVTINCCVLVDLNDFENSAVVVTFQPDQTGPQMNDVDTPVSIVDDDVNEADEQNFVVTLDIESAANKSRVIFSLRDSLCRIIDNDGEYDDDIHRFGIYMFKGLEESMT